LPTALFVNSVVWGNEDPGGLDESAQLHLTSGTYIVERSCVQGWTGGYPGTGSHGLDPLFVDADGVDDVVGTEDDDLQLGAGSPCVDAGVNGGLPADLVDLDCDGNVAELLPLDVTGIGRRADDVTVSDTGGGSAPVVDMGAYERSAWRQLGSAFKGTTEPCLVGGGTLVGGMPVSVGLTGALPSTTTWLFIGFTQLDFTPFLGGTLVPNLDVVIPNLPVDANGSMIAAGPFPTGVPAGFSFILQHWVTDPGAPFGASGSNAIEATSP
jgi:hypothetical protein